MCSPRSERRDTINIHDRLRAVAVERSLRPSTIVGYRHALARLNVTDDSITQAEVEARLWEIDSPNSRRQAAIAVRAVLGMPIQIPKPISKRYDLPDEDTIRMALMMSRYETRGLLMAYAGLRVAEACAVTYKSRRGDALVVDRQVLELHTSAARTGGEIEKVFRLGPTKSREDDVVIPAFLIPRIDALTTVDRPSSVRASIRRAGKQMGIALNPHLLRHWYATESLNRGVSMKTVSRQLRHGDIATTMRTYAQGNAQEVHDAWG